MIENCSIIVSIISNIEIVTRFLNSLERCCQGAEIIIRDNKCKDPNLSDLLKLMSERNGWNLIIGDECLPVPKNLIDATKKSTRDYLIFPNSDTIFTKNSIERLIDPLKDENIGITIPSTSYDDHRVVSLNEADVKWDDEHIEEFAEKLSKNTKVTVLRRWPMGFCLAIKKNLYDKIGGWDENAGFFSADYDLYYRVRSAGYNLAWVYHSYVHHFGHVTRWTENKSIPELVKESQIFFTTKYGENWYRNVYSNL